MIRSDNFVLIQGWMVTDLKLKGLDLMVFAIIYSFSQDPDQMFTGTVSYLQEWTNASNAGIRKCLNRLIDQQLIMKFVDDRDRVIKVSYCYNYRKIKRPL